METNQKSKGAMGEQLLLFQDRGMLLNNGMLGLVRLNLDAARNNFNRYQELYHDRDAIDGEIQLTDFLIKGFFRLPDSPPEKPSYLSRLWRSFEDHLGSVGVMGENILSQITYSFFQRVSE